MSVKKQPCLNSSANLSKSSQSSVQSNGYFGDAWHLKSCDPAFGNEVPNRNGFYNGSSSGSNELVHLPSISYDYLNSSNDQHKLLTTSSIMFIQ
jgi:hypothetical protein